MPFGFRRIRALAVAALIVALSTVWSPGRADAKVAQLVMDAHTGKILHAMNPDTPNFPASLTKMMTLYLVFEALDKKRIKLSEEMPVSTKAARQPASHLALTANSTITVKDGILALVTKSANDVAVVFSERLSGDEREFALAMTAKARKLGMKNTTFRNASGLPHRGQLSTARDMALLARALLRDFPHHYHYFSAAEFAYDGIRHKNHNKLLTSYDGVDGIKTGYIRASGFNLVASAKRDGKRLIGVVFGGRTPTERNKRMARLLDLGFKATLPPAMAEAEEEPAPKPKAKPKAPAKATVKLAKATAPATASDETRQWGIQVGAFNRQALAEAAAAKAMERLPSILESGEVRIVTTQKGRRASLHRARIVGLSKQEAARACAYYKKKSWGCMQMKIEDTEVAEGSASGG